MDRNSFHNEDQLIALYYPETICLNEQELKYLLLLYDKVYFLPIDVELNPGHTKLSSRFSIHDATLTGAFRSKRDAHYALMYMSESNIWDDSMRRLMDLYDELEEKGILVGLHDQAFESASKWHPMKEAVKADMNDSFFVKLCKRYQNPKIFIPRTENAVIKGGGFATRPSAYKGEYGIPSICSERLNSTLFFAEHRNLFPVSPYQMYVDLLSAKIKRIAQSDESLPSTHPRQSARSHRFSILSWEIMTEAVPLQAMQAKSFGEVLRYKDACIGLKNRFHSYLLGLEASMNAQPWDQTFANELDKVVKKEILPEVQTIRDKKMAIWENLFGESLKSLVSWRILPPLLGVHMVPGLSFGDILSISTAAVLGMATLPNLINAWKDERQLKRNALFFIVNFTKRKRA